MTTRPLPTDFNPATRDPARFGYDEQASRATREALDMGDLAPLPNPRGVDGNHWVEDNILDPVALALACPWNYWKLTQGIGFLDSSHPILIALKAAGAKVIFYYHFFDPGVSGVLQWNWFKQKYDPLHAQIGGKKIILVDYETGKDNDNFKILCDLARQDGFLVGLYINPSDWVTYGLGSWVNGYVDFYILAHWKPGDSPTMPPGIDPEKVMAQQEGVWDAQEHVQDIPGAKPQLDANLLLWTMDKLIAFTGQGASAPPPSGDFMVKFKVKNKMNIRALPKISSGDIGDIAAGTVITALDVVADTAVSVWVKIAEGQWLALAHAGKVYLEHI